MGNNGVDERFKLEVRLLGLCKSNFKCYSASD